MTYLFFCVVSTGFSQNNFPHQHTHAHNDYENKQPLWSAIQNGFISVEADVHLVDGQLLVSHNKPKSGARTLRELYLQPLDSLLTNNANQIYRNYKGPFYLMIDIKTEAESTYQALKKELAPYDNLRCNRSHCPVLIFISGNRAMNTILNDSYQGISLDGRPDDLGKEISLEKMPVISDTFAKWSTWKGQSTPQQDDLARVKELARRVHAEGKKLRLWAIPDNELAWTALLDAGVDFINTDRLEELNKFLQKRGM